MARKIKEKLIRSSGFSLLEVLLAVLLLAIVVTPLIQVIMTSMNLNIKAKKQQAANDLAQTVMEYLQSMTPDEIDQVMTGSGTSHVYLPFCGYVGDVYPLGSSSVAVTGNRATDFKNFKMNSFLHGYAMLMVDGSDVIVTCSSDSEFKYMYTIDGIHQDGYVYDVAIWLEPKTDISLEYVIYDIYLEVHAVDSKNLIQVHDTYDEAIYCKVHGSTFNTFD